ncbi:MULTISPECIES: LLM class flavin-dependent oxidoreductase [Pseudonocardia]|uniref:4-(Gamma-L-glutamylamino)butanoyl-[BtrI acyl-carrier protein] monooxygenase BtrO n=2 Tax=Pseudonocardia TaxID=1847 RepID=A0A1Y2N923_PSEAH|nr:MULTISPECIES: LLM class flavin-dependent oxidoreductase [Pseudonocardia]OSY43659.1 4-(gamma-L-glutamylamino)butanoyl-[BtrI acyl-carrier protein] monooxygenase BtrO [Pseudonocardia autotrophica]TDN73351.1 alkanesulfonate monooxygenase [Pseudonocardia autotrophica]
MTSIMLYSTCPQSKDLSSADYLEAVRDVSRWSEEAGCTGMLVYTDNGLVDPWTVAQMVLQCTSGLAPLVAVQPVYMHPYAVATQVSSLAYLHGRSVHLNMLAGGFRNDLIALGDPTEHDQRYERTTEYTRIVMGLLRGETMTVRGRHYTVDRLTLAPALPADLLPQLTMSGSSPAGLAAALAVDATPVRYPERPEDPSTRPDGVDEFGIRVGIIARPRSEAAWHAAHARFPTDRTGRITHRLAMAVSDSHWHRQLSDRDAGGVGDPYWLGPFQHYKTFCPYLVGSYDEVAGVLARYLELGARTIVLDIPESPAELKHIGTVVDLARESVQP